ncbi:hypothetical protein MSG28_012485 [Choristoneura fumiferana]|uniref:Uncharacterized protein n=1 Tax=Choristoneura fumiferana TaxID=7141 RepID=A0ACC0KE40_CHOFU|nr:hypothetical protein MSG28_012485 [Choristoneura fumiferana]
MARQQQDVDELFDVKNAFYVGNYQQAINEAQNVSPSSPLVALQRDTFLYRSYISQGNYRIVLQELKSADPMLQPLKSLVDYLSPGANKLAIVADIDARVQKGTELVNEVILHGAESLELRAFTLQCLLAMNRPDLARKQLTSLQEIEDDSTLTQLAQAWLNLSQGGPGVQDAHYSIMELAERLGALGAGPAAVGAAAAASRGLAVAARHTPKPPEVATRYIAQLLDSYPEHPFTKDYNAKSNEFKRLAAQYQPSVAS